MSSQLNTLATNEFNGWIAGAGDLVQDRVDKFFTDGTDELFNQLTWKLPAGDTSKEYRRFERFYLEATGRQWTGPMDLDMPDVQDRKDYGQAFTRGHVYGPFDQELLRLPNVPRPPNGVPEPAAKIAREFEAVEREIPLGLAARMLRTLIQANNGHGGTQVWKRTNVALPLYDLSNTVFTSGKPNANIKVPVVSSLTAPTIVDAEKLMEDARKHFLTIDSHRKTFVNTASIRDSGKMKVITTSDGWDTAFQQLRDDPTRAQDLPSALSEGATINNKWQGKFEQIHTNSEEGKAWENWVRIFLPGDNPESNALVWAPDIPLTRYVTETTLKIKYGFVLSYYLEAWDASTTVLMKPATP